MKMALDDENDLQDDSELDNSVNDSPITSAASNAPDFVKDIASKNSSMPMNMDYQFVPKNPYTLNGNDVDNSSDPNIKGIQESPGYFQTATAEAYNFNVTAQASHALYEKNNQVDPLDDPKPADWTPKTDVSKFVNIRPENMQYIMDATGPKDQDYRLQRVMSEQQHDDALADGSFVAKLVGGVVGIFTDPVSYIPIAGWAKYGKIGAGFLKNAARAAPGSLAYASLSAGAEQADKINGNLADFVTDTFTRTVFGSALFGFGGLLSTSAEHMNLWNARNLAKDHFDGIDYKMQMDKEGKITGFKAVDTTGSLSAAKVSLAQDMANSTFAKSGLFKIPGAILNAPGIKTVAEKIADIPYAKDVGHAVGNAAQLLYKYAGGQIPVLLNSPFAAVRGYVDRFVDHGILTEGVLQGGTAPKRFADMMKQTGANIRYLSTQMNALHLIRNGFDIKNRAAGSVLDVGLNLHAKTLGVLSKDIDKTGYIAREQFDDEVEEVLRTKNASEHAAVNDAANMMRKHMDETYSAYRKAYNLPEDWMPPKTADGYLMRVYNTPYMNVNLDPWISTISNWLKDADQVITNRMEPINTLSQTIKDFESKNTQAVNILANIDAKRIENPSFTPIEKGTTTHIPGENEKTLTPYTNELVPGSPVHTLNEMRTRLRSMKDELENELRSNPDLQLHVHDWNALSANEAQQLKEHTKKLRSIENEIEKQQASIREAKVQASKKLSSAKGQAKIEKAVPKSKNYVESKSIVATEEQKLRDLQESHFIEDSRLQQKIQNGEIPQRLVTRVPNKERFEFKDPNDRLRFRETYADEAARNYVTDEEGIHKYRKAHAKAYYNTIMSQTPEETINQVMGKYTGEKPANPVAKRTLLVPDEILYQNGFMSKDLMSKIANYTTYLARRTHLKNTFAEVTHGGGIEKILEEVNSNHSEVHTALNERKTELSKKLENLDLTPKEKKAIQGQIKNVEKEIVSKRKRLDADTDSMKHIYEKAMGMRSYKKGTETAKSVIMSLTAIGNLPFVPFTQLNDLSAIALQHGVWPFIRDGMYPVVQSLFGMMKSKDSEAFRNTAPSIHLALQDVSSGYADRNWGAQTNPYLNMGRLVGGLEKVAHASSNFTLTNYIDNYLQRMSSSVIQSEFMRILTAFKAGTMSKKDGIYIRKYGIDPNKWADRMTEAFKKDGGGKTALGGYQSLHYKWEDIEAANEFGDAIFRGVKDTQIQAGLADSPFWSDNPLGAIIKGFSGWGFASVNRYLIPAMQNPDAQKLLGILCMVGTGALIDPMRRMARGESPYSPNSTPQQEAWAAFNNSGVFSQIANLLADANMLTGDRLLGNLKNDKYKDRTMTGLLGPSWGQANRLKDVISAAATGEWNKADMNKAARMTPFANSSWTYWLTKKFIDGMNIPENRRQAHALKEINQ